MQELQTIETSVLVDMLAQATVKFTQFLRDHPAFQGESAYQIYKGSVDDIILELEKRKTVSGKGLNS